MASLNQLVVVKIFVIFNIYYQNIIQNNVELGVMESFCSDKK